MVGVMLLIVLLPVLVAVFIHLGKQQRARQVRRMQDYRKSPESHLLHLND